MSQFFLGAFLPSSMRPSTLGTCGGRGGQRQSRGLGMVALQVRTLPTAPRHVSLCSLCHILPSDCLCLPMPPSSLTLNTRSSGTAISAAASLALPRPLLASLVAPANSSCCT